MSEENKSEELKQYRGFDDEFNNYKIGELVIAVKTLSYDDTKLIKEIARTYDKALKSFDAGEIDDFERIDKQDEFIEGMLDIIISKEDKEKLTKDNSISKPTLFGFVRDFYTFLQIIGSNSEAKHLLMQSSLQTTNS